MDVHHHHRRAFVPEAVIGEFLQGHVDGEHHLVAGLAFPARQFPDRPSDGVDLDLAGARLAAKPEIMDLFDAALADAEFGKREQRLAGQFGLRNGGDITKQVGGGGGVWVTAALADVDHHARQVRGVDLDLRHLLPHQVLAHGDREEAASALDFVPDAAALVIAERDDGAELVQGLLHIRGLLGDDDDPVALLVHRQFDAETVDDAPPRRRQETQIDTVLLRQHAITRRLDDLEVIHPRRQRR